MSKSESQPAYPYKTLGQKLKTVRQKFNETVEEVSGAVEIDTGSLQRFEHGLERPGQDILLLLINHFGMKEKEANALWQLAGYELPNIEQEQVDEMIERGTVLVMTLDPRVGYSDGVQVTVNSAGVVLNFTQGTGNRQLITGRIGMSQEQASNVVRVLQDTLRAFDRQELPSPAATDTSKKPKTDSNQT